MTKYLRVQDDWTHFIEWRRPEEHWRTDAFNPYHGSLESAEAYVKRMAIGPGIEYRILEREDV